MKKFCTMFVSLGIGILTARADLPAGWSTDFTNTLAEASAHQETSLVYFTATWCGPCKLMSRTTLADPVVVQALASIKHIALDLDENPTLATRFGINAVPTFLLLSAEGKIVGRSTGFQPPAEFLQWLTNSLADAKEAAAQLVLAKGKLAEVDQWLASTNVESTQRTTVALFGLCAARDAGIVQAAASRLQTLAARDPVAVLEGLGDTRLAVRIQVANVLRAHIGERFDVDAWADSAVRAGAVAKWKQMLTAKKADASATP